MGFVPPARPQHDSPEASEEAALQQWEMLASEEGERSSSAEQAADEDDAPETAEAAVETMQDAKAEAPAPSDPAPVEAPSGSFSSPGVAISSQCTTLHGSLPHAAVGAPPPALELSVFCSGNYSAMR